MPNYMQENSTRVVRHGLTMECVYAANKLQDKRECAGTATSEWRYQFDAQGRLLSVLRNGTEREKYSYNARGQRVEQHRHHHGAHTITDGNLYYDEHGRLQRAGDVHFSYDHSGALCQRASSQGTINYFYGLAQDAPASQASEQAGNSDTMLDKVKLPGRVEITYEYDKANPISPARRFKCGILSMEYAWQKDELGMPLLVSCHDYEYQTRYGFSYTSKGLLDRVSVTPMLDSPIKGGWCGTDYLADMVRSERLTRLHKFLGNNQLMLFCGTDQVGTPKIFSAKLPGGISKKLDYDSFGNLLEDSRPDLFILIGFAGGLLDRDTNLLRFGWRDYDPTVGRFTAPDPAINRHRTVYGQNGAPLISVADQRLANAERHRGDGDLYDYCIDDPVSRIDSSGLWSKTNVDPEIQFTVNKNFASKATKEAKVGTVDSEYQFAVDKNFASKATKEAKVGMVDPEYQHTLSSKFASDATKAERAGRVDREISQEMIEYNQDALINTFDVHNTFGQRRVLMNDVVTSLGKNDLEEAGALLDKIDNMDYSLKEKMPWLSLASLAYFSAYSGNYPGQAQDMARMPLSTLARQLNSERSTDDIEDQRTLKAIEKMEKDVDKLPTDEQARWRDTLGRLEQAVAGGRLRGI